MKSILIFLGILKMVQMDLELVNLIRKDIPKEVVFLGKQRRPLRLMVDTAS
jgi:hypothetical protein